MSDDDLKLDLRPFIKALAEMLADSLRDRPLPPAPKDSPDKRKLYSKRGAAQMLGVSARTLDRWSNVGLLRATRLGKLVKFSGAELERFTSEDPYADAVAKPRRRR